MAAAVRSRLFPLGERLQQDVQGAQVGRVGVQDQRLAGDADRVLDPRRVPRNLLDAGHEAFRALDGGGVGQLHVQEQVSFVLLGDEAGGHGGQLPAGEPQQTAIQQQDDQAHAQDAADRRAVERRQPIEGPVEDPEEPTQGNIDRPNDQPAHQPAEQRTGNEGDQPINRPAQPAGPESEQPGTAAPARR